MSAEEVAHIAGLPIQYGNRFRQRCAWCGALILDMDLDRTAVHSSDGNNSIAAWEEGSLVAVAPGVKHTVEHTPGVGAPLPPGMCVNLDPEVTS